MKKRNDFVTNSSSSSYIIGKTEDNTVTKEVVYQLVKRLYQQLLDDPDINDETEANRYSEETFAWLVCETYEDYEAYWLVKMEAEEEKGRYIHAPFTIADFAETKDVHWLHEGGEKRPHEINSDTEVLNWYYDYAYAAFHCEDFCNMCEEAKECIPIQEEIKKRNIPEEKACLYLLGRICIYSEECYMPLFVEEKLCSIAEYACRHMG